MLLPRTVTELLTSDAFERVWRNAAADQMAERFGRGDDGQPPPTRNMIGDYMASDEFHQAVCKAGSQGMSSMGGMMGNAPAPWSYMGTFIGSDKFSHGTCDMMSQGMLQFGQGMNGWFRSGDDGAQGAARAIDEFFASRYYRDGLERLQAEFADVTF